MAEKDLAKATQSNESLSIVILGASGDLATKKTFPSLFSLYKQGLLPQDFVVYGFARSQLSQEHFKKKISQHFASKQDEAQEGFISRCFYFQGQYNDPQSFRALDKELRIREGGAIHNRLWYMAVPPTIYVPAARSIHGNSTCLYLCF